MKRLLISFIFTVVCLSHAPVNACAGFCVSQGDGVLVGKNEDWKNPSTTVIIITRAGSKRFGRTQDQEKKELHAVSDTGFVYVSPDVNVNMTFVKDPNDKVVKFIAEVQGQTFPADRIT